jgi:hypothetical protein
MIADDNTDFRVRKLTGGDRVEQRKHIRAAPGN